MHSSNNHPGKLRSLGLHSDEITNLLEQLLKIPHWYTFGDDEHIIRVHIERLKKQQYFAFVDCESLCGIHDKSAFIQSAVESAMHAQGLTLPFESIAVGGLASDEGRLAFVSTMQGDVPPPVHEYCVFKLPTESNIVIEDPRASILSGSDKFQSRFDNQVCCFASATLFYAAYLRLKNEVQTTDTQALLKELYLESELKMLVRNLEIKVGRTNETKEEVISHFVEALHEHFKPSLWPAIAAPSASATYASSHSVWQNPIVLFEKARKSNQEMLKTTPKFLTKELTPSLKGGSDTHFIHALFAACLNDSSNSRAHVKVGLACVGLMSLMTAGYALHLVGNALTDIIQPIIEHSTIEIPTIIPGS